MKITVRLAVLFYMTTLLFLGCMLVVFVIHGIKFEEVSDILYIIYYDPKMRAVFGLVAAVILFLNFVFAKSIAGEQQKGKTIAFDNPSGRVSVSLSALEDLIRRVVSRVPEVKESRSAITAGRRGLEINARLVLNADVNIPEMTSKIQDLVKHKVQDMIGIEETVVVRVHVVKIVSGSSRPKRAKDQEDDQPRDAEPPVPFQGYRA